MPTGSRSPSTSRRTDMEVPNRVARPRFRSTLWTGAAIAFAVLVAPGLVIGCLVVRSASVRFNAYGGYANALTYYYDRHGSMPVTLSELEECYQAYDHRRANLPPPPPFERPTFRPLPPSAPGMSLMIVEPEQRGFFDWTRYLIYASTDSNQPRIDSVWTWQVAGRVRDDDARRPQHASVP